MEKTVILNQNRDFLQLYQRGYHLPAQDQTQA